MQTVINLRACNDKLRFAFSLKAAPTNFFDRFFDSYQRIWTNIPQKTNMPVVFLLCLLLGESLVVLREQLIHSSVYKNI